MESFLPNLQQQGMIFQIVQRNLKIKGRDSLIIQSHSPLGYQPSGLTAGLTNTGFHQQQISLKPLFQVFPRLS